jgi:RNA polymerase sigma factor (sigma-70 family)
LRPDSNHRAWLYKIAGNCAWTQLRRLKHRRDEALSLRAHAANSRAMDHSHSPGEPSLAKLIARLPMKQRACVTLRYFQELDYAEIAAMMHCTEASARANVYQAIRHLRRALEE